MRWACRFGVFREPRYKIETKRTLHVHSNRNGLLKARQSSTVFSFGPLLFKYSQPSLWHTANRSWREMIWVNQVYQQATKRLVFPFIFRFFNDFFFLFHLWQAMCLPPGLQTKSSHEVDITCIEQVRVAKIHAIKVSNIEISDNV